VKGLLWAAVVLCAVLGIVAAALRGTYVGTLAARAEPVRLWLFDAVGRQDAPGSDRSEQVRAVDLKYGAHRILTRLHVLPGALFMLLVPLQLVKSIRSRRPGFHRWNGRVVVAAGLLAVLLSFYFAFVSPLGGRAESVIVGVIGTIFIVSFGKAIVAIRRGDRATHREWMLRALAIALGISVERLVVIPLDLWLAPSGMSTSAIFVISIVVGWSISIGVGEWWIRATRPALREAFV
jgi:hypothetical protein